MDVKFEVSDKKCFEACYEKAISEINENGMQIKISEDAVGFGIENELIIGLVFIYNSALSGITWDILKPIIQSKLCLFTKYLRKNDKVVVYLENNNSRFELEIPKDFPNVEINISEKLRISLKK